MLAIAHLSIDLAAMLSPTFEVPPTDARPTKDADRFTGKVLNLSLLACLSVSTRGISSTRRGVRRRPMSDIADDLAMRGKPILPVLRLSDSDAQLADAGYAAECHEGRAIVRLGSMVADPDDEEAEVQINRLHDHAGLAPDQCDLVIDLFEVRDERDVTRAEPVVRKVRRLGHPPTRASITVTAGAMPQSLTALATRRRRNFSWGDQEIALGASGDCGPGNAMQWRARGTSHHLAHVADQLRRLSQRIPLYAVRPTVHGHDHRAVTCIERWLTRSVEWEGE